MLINLSEDKSAKEKIAQQKLCINNNLNPKAEYYCIDLEYIRQRKSKDEELSGRFDIIALSKNKPYSVALIELKFGKDAISGKSGVIKHITDFISFASPKANSSLFLEHLRPEIVEIVNSYVALRIEMPFKDLTVKDIEEKPEFYFITLGNENDIARREMKKYVLEGEGHSNNNFEKIIGHDISRKNDLFFAKFLFSEDDGSNIKDILCDNLYDKRDLHDNKE